MIPENSYGMEELEFAKEIRALGKKEFVEFRKKFREFSSEIQHRTSPADISEDSVEKGDRNEKLRLISRKLHLIKREYERREAADQIQNRIKEMLMTPEEMLAIDDPDFNDAVRHMNSRDFAQYVEGYRQMYAPILQERKKIIKLNSPAVAFDKQNRDNLKIIKRWDLLEGEMSEREHKGVSVC